MAGNWKTEANKVLRRLVIERNMIANSMSKDIQGAKAVSIPYLEWREVTKAVKTKEDFKQQAEALNAFIKAERTIEQHGNILIPKPLEREIDKRRELVNLNTTKEANYAREQSKELLVGGERKPNISMGDARVSERMLSTRPIEDYRGKYDYEKFVDRVYYRSLQDTGARAWSDYRKNYIKGIESWFNQYDANAQSGQSNGQQMKELTEKAVEKLKKKGLSDFRKAYYSDLLGDIDYIQSGESLSDEDILGKLTTLDYMFGLGLFDE